MHTRLLYEIQFEKLQVLQVLSAISVTRLVYLLHFGQLFRVCGNSYFAQIAHIFQGIFVKVSKSCIFLVITFLGNNYRHQATFYWSHWFRSEIDQEGSGGGIPHCQVRKNILNNILSWHSWQNGRFRHQRTWVRIQPFEILLNIYLMFTVKKKMQKESGSR